MRNPQSDNKGAILYQVTKIIHFCYGHRLLNYDGKCKHPHGHNGKIEICLSSETLDARGMVYDFSDISKEIKTWIDDHLDHQMILKEEDPLIPIFKELKEPFFVLKENPTAENIAKLIFEQTKAKGFPVQHVTLWETESSFATYKK